MKFVLVVMALLLDRTLAPLDNLRQPQWLEAFWPHVRARLESMRHGDGTVAVLFAVAAPALLVWLAVSLLAAIWSVLGFLAALGILLLTLGPVSLRRQVEDYQNAVREGRHGDAERLAALLSGRAAVPANGSERHSVVIEGLLVAAEQRLFGVLFWFVLLGPVGAVVYRASTWLSAHARESWPADEPLHRSALRLQGVLDWLPVRLLALAYGLAGSFEDALADWRAYAERAAAPFHAGNAEVLRCAALGALRLESDAADDAAGLAGVTAALGLVDRALLVWLVVLALFSLAGMVI